MEYTLGIFSCIMKKRLKAEGRMQQILIIEDDRALNQGLCKALKTDNNSMQVCSGLYASATDRQIVSCENLKMRKNNCSVECQH